MELEITTNNANNNSLDTDVNNLIKDLENAIEQNQTKRVTLKDIKVDSNSELSLVSNIAKNNKMTTENKEKLFLEEIKSIYSAWNNRDKRAGEIYYITSKGVDDNFYAFKVNNDLLDEDFVFVNKSEFPDGIKAGQIYRKKKNGEIYLSEDETKAHEKNMKKIAKDILNEQISNGGYKREFSKKDLILGEGYEGIYFEYPLGSSEELGKEAGLPPTMINNFLINDINQVYADVAKALSENKIIYTALPKDRFSLYKFYNGEMEKLDSDKGIKAWDYYGKILVENKSGQLTIDTESTKLFEDKILENLKSTVKPKYDKICDDYKKEDHIYEVKKALDENYTPTITIRDVSESRFLKLEDLDFIENRYAGNGKYVVKNGEYCKINAVEKIPKNNTIDKEKEDEKNLSTILAKKYDISKDDINKIMKDFMIERSKKEGVIVYTGYDMKKDEYYRDYYKEGSFDEREVISKKTADNMEVGTFCVMGEDELHNYSGYFSADRLVELLEERIESYKIDNSLKL